MRKIFNKAVIVSAFMIFALTGCSEKKDDSKKTTEGVTTSEASVTDSSEEVTESKKEETPTDADNNSQVADASEMTSVDEVVEEGMIPIKADMINDGTYEVVVSSSSSMFNIESCELKVENGTMTAVMTMGGKGYLYIYPGTAEEAASANEADYISYVEDADGAHTFEIPVDALDEGIPCAAFSKKKEKWYDRTILFRADSLPMEAYKDGVFTTAASLGLEDGTYSVEVTLNGGSGKAGIDSPAGIKVENGVCTATIVWSSPNYDYMIVNGEKYLPVNTDGNSTFEIPVSMFDRNMPVTADTTAMSEPHEIEYTLNFDSATIQK